MGIRATLPRQCRLFAVGSALFAVATAPFFAQAAGAGVTNLLWSHVTGVQMTQQLGADGCVVELEVTELVR